MSATTTVARFRLPAQPPVEERSLWLQQAMGWETIRHPAEQVPARTDVCIIGGGFAGLWTAIHLKRMDPSVDVTILEAGHCGSGASGRNGGFVMTSWSKFGTLKKLCGVEDALVYARGCEQAVTDIGKFCSDNGIDAQYHQAGWVWTATNRAQSDAWKYTIDELASAGEHPYRELEPEEVAARSGSALHIGGVFEERPATIHPGHLSRGLTEVARGLGVKIVEYAPVTELKVDPAPLVSTTRGDLRADRVILTMAAWATGVAEVRRSVVVVGSDVIATDPVPDRLTQLGWPTGISISDSRRLVHYLRPTDDGRVVFGKGGGAIGMGDRIPASFNRSAPASRLVRRHFDRLYPTLADVGTAQHWRGPVDYSSTGVPFTGPLRGHPEILVAAGFSGNGVGPSYVAATALAEMALAREVRWVPEGLRAPRPGLPPEPARYVGGQLVRAAVKRKEDAEDRGASPPRLLRMIAGLDPTSFTDSGASNV